MVMLKQCQDKREWDDYILEYGGHPLQLWGWGDVKEAHGWRASRLFMFDEEEKKVGAVQLLVRKLPQPFRSLAYVPRGPITDSSRRVELLDELAKFVKRNYHSVALTIEPDAEEYEMGEGWRKSEGYILPSNTIILDLSQPESYLMTRMAKKTRQYIRKSGNEGLDIKTIRNRDGLQECIELYKETAKRASFNLHKEQYYYDVFDKMSDNSQIFAAYADGKIVAFLWLAISAETAFELYGGMNDVGQHLRANYALKWHAIRKCKIWGLRRYDFGGLIDGGVKNFKMGWTDEATELAGTFDRPLSIHYRLWNSALPIGKKLVRKAKTIMSR